MELRRYLTVIWSRWRVIAVVAIAGIVGGWTITPQSTTYTATGTVYIGTRVLSQADVTVDRALALSLFARTAGEMIHSLPRAGQAAQVAGVDRSAQQVLDATTALPRLGTQLLDVRVKDHDPAVAQKLANALVDQFVVDVRNLEPDSVGATEGRLPTVPASVSERAKLPTEPNDNGLIRNLMLGTIIGLLMGIGLVLLFDYVDITVRNAADAEDRLELPVLGVIPALGESLPTTPALRAVRTKARSVR